ncbi:MAG: matrixin family metalloprotease [Alphaproteobacteria bacterium]|nr:MAG: matrixin family metalloprotease [Alphaproteobacteria bacterium]
MVDTIPEDTSTTASVTVGGSYTGNIDFEGDQDWVAVELEAGVTYSIDMEGVQTGSGTLIDPWIKGIYDSDGNSLSLSDDDGGEGRNSQLVFTPTESGTYYIDAGNWIDTSFGGEDPTGTYKLSVSVYEAEPTTPTSAADSENVDASGETGIDALLGLTRYQNVENATTTHITYSVPTTGSVWSTATYDYGPQSGDGEPWQGIEYLTTSEANIFRDALSQIEAFAGVTFEEVADNSTSAGTIRIAWTGIQDEDAAAWAYLPSGSVQAGDIWLLSENQDTGGEGSYFQLVVLHELGHAMGLKHTFDTDGTGVTMPAEYDGLEYTVMAYNSSVVSEDILGLSFYPTTYMYWDIKALQYLYGDIEKDTGDTTYTFERNVNYYETVWDTGGTDTYDASAQVRAVDLDLTPGSWSNVGTRITMYGSFTNQTKSDTVYTPPEITIENAIGGSGNDTLTGNTADNYLIGGAGNDKLAGGSGEDTLEGGTGTDTLTGGSGSDYFMYEMTGGDDIVSDFDVDEDYIDLTGAGLSYANMTISTSGGSAVISSSGGGTITLTGVSVSALSSANFYDGTEPSNIIDGTAGDDSLTGTSDDDTFGGSAGADTIDGADGNDTVTYASSETAVSLSLVQSVGYSGDAEGDRYISVENVIGTDYDDSLIGNRFVNNLAGGGGNDTLIAGYGYDYLSGGDGDDSLMGGYGVDTLVGGAGADTLNGEQDNDWVSYEGSSAGVSLTLTGNGYATGSGGDAEGDLVANVQRISGSDYDDTLGGNVLNNWIVGGAGNDTLSGNVGVDTIEGGAGDDVIRGNYTADSLSGDAGADAVFGGYGDDTVYGGDGNDTLLGERDSDYISGGEGADLIGGGTEADTLYGDAGNDTLKGSEGADFIDGGTGDDSIEGGQGADTITGGAGDDIMSGGSEFDTFVFADGHGDDTITDFQVGKDVLDLSDTDIDFVDLDDLRANAYSASVDGEAGLMIETGDGDTIFLVGLNSNHLVSLDIVY